MPAFLALQANRETQIRKLPSQLIGYKCDIGSPESRPIKQLANVVRKIGPEKSTSFLNCHEDRLNISVVRIGRFGRGGFALGFFVGFGFSRHRQIITRKFHRVPT